MTAQHLRDTFLAYFQSRGHVVVPSSSLIPDNDSSVLFTTAGMQQFMPFFLGSASVVERFGSTALVSVQKCFRTSDIESVGDESHHTFFEMLGNFSIADPSGIKKNYYKDEAINLSFDFLTRVIGLDAQRIWITVFKGDKVISRDSEAEAVWSRYIAKNRIRAFGQETNWWGPPGKTGPCGPSSEIHIDQTGISCQLGSQCIPNCECGRFLELWNLVFTEYEKTAQGAFKRLKHSQIDTGMGLERLLAVIAGEQDTFAIDIFQPVFRAIVQNEFFKDEDINSLRRKRIIADHVRSAVYLLSDGVTFSNKDQGYILRRIVRRALDQSDRQHGSLSALSNAVIAHDRKAYPELHQHRSEISRSLIDEARIYNRVTTAEVADVLLKIRRNQKKEIEHPTPSSTEISPEEALRLYTTYGLSRDRILADGFTFDELEFNKLLNQHRNISRKGSEQKFGGHGLRGEFLMEGRSPDEISKITRLHSATHILHQALRRVLGPEVRQAGSDITPERLRFDFSYSRKLTDKELQKIEGLANKVVQQDLPVTSHEMPLDEALKSKALSYFREKYPERVTVYSIGDYSSELCGGPHVKHTAQIGPIHILSEKSSAAGIRRLKAVIGPPT